MKFDRLLLSAFAMLALAPVGATAAIAQQSSSRPYRPGNVQATADMRSRLAAAIDRVRVAERHGQLTRTKAAALRQRIIRAQREMEVLRRRQGFVSAAELASYGRVVDDVDAAMGAGPDRRPYGNDMLPAPAGRPYGDDMLPAPGGRPYGNDALPSAETTAFQRMDARLHYRDAGIEYDARGCAVYQGTAPDGRVRHEPLHGPNGAPICSAR